METSKINTTLNPNQPQEVDPLAMSASEANTDYPLLKPDKVYRLSVKKLELIDAKKEDAPPGAQNLRITLATTKDELDTDDNVLHAGYTVTKFIPLYVSGGRKPTDIQRDIGTFVKAVEGEKTKTRLDAIKTNPEQFINKPVDCKVGIGKDKSGQYPDSNTVRFVIPSGT